MYFDATLSNLHGGTLSTESSALCGPCLPRRVPVAEKIRFVRFMAIFFVGRGFEIKVVARILGIDRGHDFDFKVVARKFWPRLWTQVAASIPGHHIVCRFGRLPSVTGTKDSRVHDEPKTSS